MSKNLIAIIVAAGVAAFAYHKIGRSIGYGNPKRVWIVSGSVFVVCYLVLIVTFTWVLHF